MPQIIKNGQTPEYYFEERCHIAELLNNQDCPGLSVVRARVEESVTTFCISYAGQMKFTTSFPVRAKWKLAARPSAPCAKGI